VRLFLTGFNFVTARSDLTDSAILLCSCRFLLSRRLGTRRALCLAMLNKSENTDCENGTNLVTIEARNFRAEVLESKLPVLVEFWTSWSRACEVSNLVLQELSREWMGKIRIVKVNADDSLDLSLWYEIQSIPTLIYFAGGKPQFRIVGTATKDAILERLKSLSISAAKPQHNEEIK
jgi:thioredoxin 1